MGYRIPPPDFTLPPMQINVAAEMGKTIAAGLDKAFAIRRQEKEKAQKIKNTQNAFKNGLILQQQELKNEYFKSLEKAGIIDDPAKENELFDQFKIVVDEKAKASLEARMKMEFGTDIDDEERMKLGQTVTDFKSYTKNSLTQMGGLLADSDLVNDSDHVVVGDIFNGEQISNTIGLNNINGANARSFDPNAKSSRTLTIKNNQNIVTSTVKIPVNSNYFKNVNKVGGGDGGDIMLQNGVEAGIIKTENIDGKDYYVFKTDFNVSNYSTRGGMDLVQSKLATINSDETLMELSMLDSQGAFSKGYIDPKEVITQEIETDIDGTKTGYIQQVGYKIIDVGSMVESKAYQQMLAVEYGGVFEDTTRTEAQRQKYLLDIGIPQNIKTINGLDENVKKAKIMRAIEQNMWDGYFPGAYKSSGRVPQQVQIKLDDSPQGKALLEELNDRGYKNPTTSVSYQKGDYVYVIREEQSRAIDEDSTSKKDMYSAYLEMSDEEIAKDLEKIELQVTGRGTRFYSKNGKIYKYKADFPTDKTKGDEITPEVFRATLKLASSTERNK